MKLGQLEINLDKLQHFIVKAKKSCYASGGEENRREADGSKTFMFQEGDFYYTDNYAGYLGAPGDEIIRWQKEDGQRVWHMAHSGGMAQEFLEYNGLTEQTFDFSREVLRHVTLKHPFRGPPFYENENFRYRMRIRGDIRRFSGDDWILNKDLNRIVCSQDWIGGLVIPK